MNRPQASNVLIEIPGGHPHRRPSPGEVFAVLDYTRGWGVPAATVDPEPVWWALAALRGQCGWCLDTVARWMGEHGSPWLIARLAGPIAHDARLLARRIGAVPADATGDAATVRAVTSGMFGPDVVDLVVRLASDDAPAAAAAGVRELSAPRRARAAREILDGIGRWLSRRPSGWR